MLFSYRILFNKDRGIVPAPLLKQFIKILAVLFRKFIIKPFVKDKDLIVVNPFPAFLWFLQGHLFPIPISSFFIQDSFTHISFPVIIRPSDNSGFNKVCDIVWEFYYMPFQGFLAVKRLPWRIWLLSSTKAALSLLPRQTILRIASNVLGPVFLVLLRTASTDRFF